MASISGLYLSDVRTIGEIEAKSELALLKTMFGLKRKDLALVRESEPVRVLAGSLRLQSETIAEWEMAMPFLVPRIYMRPEYRATRLAEAMYSPMKYLTEMDAKKAIAPLIVELYRLDSAERDWKLARRKKNKGLFEITDGTHVSQWFLPEELYEGEIRTVEEVLDFLSEEEAEALEKARKACRFEKYENVYWEKDDFCFGQPISLDSIRV